MGEADGGGPGRPARRPVERCPVCGRAPAPPHRPFCSARCARIDLGRWLTGAYAIPTEEGPRTPGRAEDGEQER
ncbi:hypothetical protein GCM10010964_42800 [Caldovatus sediminis]|uniref:DNA gyrase inhibitor YacG n=1 Tax=Caldovatus sediminis TaxID=2041189 RepID=A0A8J3EEA5_9PROT|nr:DNA gyrase inhibitor YacG [Caldovatus sediminis]GGG50983.1 hypothetical protein GCM10010964_42800 [Caldovatus sediminis]